MKKGRLNLEAPAYTLGIVSIVYALFSPFLGLIFGIIGLVFSLRTKTNYSKNAMILNIVGVVLGIIITILTLLLFPQIQGSFPVQ